MSDGKLTGEPKLTFEAREAVRNYVLSLAAIPGILLAVLSFFLGFFIKDVAIEKAQSKATNLVSEEVEETREYLEKVNGEFNETRRKLNDLESEFADSRIKLKEFDSEVEFLRRSKNELSGNLGAVQGLAKAAKEELKILGENPEQTEKVLRAFNNAKNAKSLLLKFEELEQTMPPNQRISYQIHDLNNSFKFVLYVVKEGEEFKVLNDGAESVEIDVKKMRPFCIDLQSDRLGGIKAKSGATLLPALKKGKYNIYFAYIGDGGWKVQFMLNQLEKFKSDPIRFHSGPEGTGDKTLLDDGFYLLTDPLFTISVP